MSPIVGVSVAGSSALVAQTRVSRPSRIQAAAGGPIRVAGGSTIGKSTPDPASPTGTGFPSPRPEPSGAGTDGGGEPVGPASDAAGVGEERPVAGALADGLAAGPGTRRIPGTPKPT